MKTINIYRAHYKEICSQHDDVYDKYEWAASYIFDLCTYDAELDEKFVKDIIEVCKVIIDRWNFEYIEDEDKYVKFILVCQLFTRFHWINWGTSIRGAWFENCDVRNTKNILEEYACYSWDEKTGKRKTFKTEAVPFSYNNIQDLIKFMEEPVDND